jgi:hypothetical protein
MCFEQQPANSQLRLFTEDKEIPVIGNTPAQPAVPAIPLDATRPRMLNETAAELVQHLDHPNGWWRDTAQRLLILKQDRSVVAALQRLAGTAKSLEGRFHALWTLEGLRALDASFVREQMQGRQSPDAGPGNSGQRDALQGR